jgi:hypothetical protein
MAQALLLISRCCMCPTPAYLPGEALPDEKGTDNTGATMAIPFCTPLYSHASATAEEGTSQPEAAAGGAKPREPAAGKKSPHGFFGHPLTRRGAIPRSKRRHYTTSVRVAAGGRFM